MTAQPGEAIPGGLPSPEMGQNPVAVPSPLELEQNALYRDIAVAQRQLAPGSARAPWSAWNRTPERRSAVPTLVRIGRDVNLDAPALVPLLGEGNIQIGDPENTHLQRPAPIPRGTPLATRGALLEQHRLDAVVENANRGKRRGVEHHTAVEVAKGLITRSLNTMHPGAVRVSLYDSQSIGHDFVALSPLTEHKPSLLDVRTQPSQLSGLLQEVMSEIADTNTRMLRGYPSMRALIEAGHPLPKPWRVVTLLGSGEELNAQEVRMLRQAMQYGPECGISFIVHGFDLGSEPAAENVMLYMDPAQLHRGRYAPHTGRVSTVDGRTITLDPAPSNQLIAATSARSASIYTPPEPNGQRGHIPNQQQYAQNLPSVQYRAIVDERERRVAAADANMQAFYNTRPLLQPAVLQREVVPSQQSYVQMATRAAASGWRAFREVWKSFGQNSEATTAQQLQAWAAMELLRHAPGNRLASVASAANSAHAETLIRHNLTAVADLVGVTTQHGHDSMPNDMRDYIGQYLHDEPPAWALQIVLDEILDAHWRVRASNSIRKAVPPAIIDALCTDLEATYNVRLRQGRQVEDQNLVTCLAQCRLLELYDFHSATPELRTLLVRRVHRDLEGFTPEQLPEGARGIHAAALRHLEAIGGPILTAKEKLARAAGALITPKETAEETEPNPGQ
jgi:hypothetical protein